MIPAPVNRQPSLSVPLIAASAAQSRALGVIGLRCRVTLHLATRGGPPASAVFVVDSGASYSFVSLELATVLGVRVPPPADEVELALRTAVGNAAARVRPGRILAWWDGQLRGQPHDWPVLFRVGMPLGLPSILGLGGVVGSCRWAFDGTPLPDSPHGTLTLEDIR